jgi:hypothetical protein
VTPHIHDRISPERMDFEGLIHSLNSHCFPAAIIRHHGTMTDTMEVFGVHDYL